MSNTRRYRLNSKIGKITCPSCGHSKEFRRYVDTRTHEPLPEEYGWCERSKNCDYRFSPYDKGASGRTYANDVYEREKLPPEWYSLAAKLKVKGSSRLQVEQRLMQDKSATAEQAQQIARRIFDQPDTSKTQPQQQPAKIYMIPDEVFEMSLGHYHRNQFARLLMQQVGEAKAIELLKRFQIGTSEFFLNATVFWYIDEQGRIRGGQIVQFDNDWHRVKWIDRNGDKRPNINWVNKELIRNYKKAQQPIPDWLNEYDDKAERSPCLFGLPQLLTESHGESSATIPIAIVEAPKTAILCTHYFPGFIWLAVGSLSYLKAERLSPIIGRKLMLYPDLGAYKDWCERAEKLRQGGFLVEISDFLENQATDQQRQAGLDLADFLLMSSPKIVHTVADQLANPGSTLRPNPQEVISLLSNDIFKAQGNNDGSSA